MSETTTTEAAATETVVTTEQNDQKPTDTVEFWKQKAREQEKRAKDNATAAQKLAELEDAQKSETQRATDKVAAAEAEVATIPAKVADALKVHLIDLHKIDQEDAELFLTATEPELLLKQVTRLLGQSDKRQRKNHVPREGDNPKAEPTSDLREFTRGLFGKE
ncbi:hypothetical protein [Mycolicibacterium setense]